jgi:hypothetical protein
VVLVHLHDAEAARAGHIDADLGQDHLGVLADEVAVDVRLLAGAVHLREDDLLQRGQLALVDEHRAVLLHVP